MVGLLERVEHVVYNVAVLIGPSGEIIGKYRKVCLPRTEVEMGITPGTEFPVFETRFGKVGMMIWGNIGDYKAQLLRHRPATADEQVAAAAAQTKPVAKSE